MRTARSDKRRWGAFERISGEWQILAVVCALDKRLSSSGGGRRASAERTVLIAWTVAVVVLDRATTSCSKVEVGCVV